MEMLLRKFYEMQEELDRKITINKNLRDLKHRKFDSKKEALTLAKAQAENKDLARKEFLAKRILALMVETGEFANETKSFKYWSTREHEITRVKALEEYVDMFHFFLSIGNTCEFTPEEIEEAYLLKYHENIKRQENNY